MTAPTCYSCRFSEGRVNGLWCVLWQNWATRACKRFEYEPGADESERGE